MAHDLLILDPSNDMEFLDEIRQSISQEDSSFVEELCKQKEFPAIKIEHLAVHKDFQSQQIGKCLISTIIGEIISNKNWYGCQYLTVDSLNNSDTNKFYENNGFSYVSNRDMNKPTRKMYQTLINLFT